MLIFSQEGFISVEKHQTSSGYDVVVSARDKKALDALAASADVEIAKSPKADYPYRVFITKNAFAEWLMRGIDDLDYLNFSSRISEKRGSLYLLALSDVKDATQRVEDSDARSGLRPGFIKKSPSVEHGPENG